MATVKGPGKAFRTGISLKKLMAMSPTDDKAREWFEAHIWPNGAHCPRCGSFNVQCGIRHETMTRRCRACGGRPRFGLKTGNVMHGSRLGNQTWAAALCLAMTVLKGVSGIGLRRDLEITQTSAWHLARRIRKMLGGGEVPMFHGPAEADETHVGGWRKNMLNRAAARRTGKTDTRALPGFAWERVESGATLHTGKARASARIRKTGRY